MAKISKWCIRMDVVQEHIHTLPNGEPTQGSLAKPTKSNMARPHSHLYEHETKVHESGISDEAPGHTHETIMGDTSGPKSPAKKESFGPRNDSAAFRVGREWLVNNDNGVVIGRGMTAQEAENAAKKARG